MSGLAIGPAPGRQGRMTEPDVSPTPRLRVRITLAPGAMIGPGKAELLERIGQTGSIAAAGRAMGMSYKRAWMLAEALNAMFREPLVASTRGGPGGGGAVLTETGQRVLALYREAAARAETAAGTQMSMLAGLRVDIPDEK